MSIQVLLCNRVQAAKPNEWRSETDQGSNPLSRRAVSEICFTTPPPPPQGRAPYKTAPLTHLVTTFEVSSLFGEMNEFYFVHATRNRHGPFRALLRNNFINYPPTRRLSGCLSQFNQRFTTKEYNYCKGLFLIEKKNHYRLRKDNQSDMYLTCDVKTGLLRFSTGVFKVVNTTYAPRDSFE